MNRIYYAKTSVDLFAVEDDPDVHSLVRKQLANHLARFIDENATITQTDDPIHHQLEVRSEVAILAVEEFNRLKHVESEYIKIMSKRAEKEN